MKSPIDNLINHVIATLPDSISARKQLLIDTLDVLPASHVARRRLKTMLTYLESHEQQQLEFSILITNLQSAVTHPRSKSAQVRKLSKALSHKLPLP